MFLYFHIFFTFYLPELSELSAAVTLNAFLSRLISSSLNLSRLQFNKNILLE